VVAAAAVVVSMGEASAVALSMAAVVSVVDVSPVVVSMAVAFVGDVSAVAVSTAAAFVATVLVITDSPMTSSSEASAFPGGGAGAIRTDITVTTITRTITMAMDTEGSRTTTMGTAGTVTTVAPGTVTTVVPVTDTAMAADQGISGVCEDGDKPGYGSLKIRDEAKCESSKSGRPQVRRQVW
jgi:hypothetical protein